MLQLSILPRKVTREEVVCEGECPICHEDMDHTRNGIFVCSIGFGANIHYDYMKRWNEEKHSQPGKFYAGYVDVSGRPKRLNRFAFSQYSIHQHLSTITNDCTIEIYHYKAANDASKFSLGPNKK